MTGKRIGYVRVSTIDQNTARQLDGVAVDKVFEDHASGKDTNRPQFQAMMEFIREGDTLVVWSMDRLSRSLADLIKTVEGLVERGVKVEFVKEGLSFTGKDNATSMMILGVFGLINQFFLAQLHEAQAEGIAKAKLAGKFKGRKPSMTVEKFDGLLTRKKAGETVSALCRESGISRETFYAYLNSATKPRAIGAPDNLGTNPLDNRDDGLLSLS